MSVRDTIEQKLTKEFAPTAIEVLDESHLHAGHSGNPGGDGETHFRVRMTSEQFAGKMRVAQHRMVNEVLADELKHPVHALALELKAG